MNKPLTDMNLSERENELIRKALDRELSDEEEKEVEVLKGNSKEFKEELLLQKSIISALKAQLCLDHVRKKIAGSIRTSRD